MVDINVADKVPHKTINYNKNKIVINYNKNKIVTCTLHNNTLSMLLDIMKALLFLRYVRCTAGTSFAPPLVSLLYLYPVPVRVVERESGKREPSNNQRHGGDTSII